jgi:ferric-dicitrate binding protein FerR (iron transport regulator)
MLIAKDLNGKISVAEKIELDAWANESTGNREFLCLSENLSVESIGQLLEPDLEAVKTRIDTMCDIGGHQRAKKRKVIWRYSAAAAVLLAVAGLSLAKIGEKTASGLTGRQTRFRYEEGVLAAAGPNDPRLILSDGSEVFLNSLQIDQVFKADGWKIVKTDQHAISYSPDSDVSQQPIDHTIAIPYGESWNISLCDGSEVQLNAGSVMSYRMLAQAQRDIMLRGEAFFKIAPDVQRPFIVRTTSSIISVLGTSFNVRDYAKQDDFRATLIQGAISVLYKERAVKLRPGDEAWIHPANKVMGITHNADTTASLEWRVPYFNFEHKNAKECMQQLVDWYGMKGFRFENNVDTVKRELLGSGYISKEIHLRRLLKLLSGPNIVFGIAGKMIIIRKISK